MQQLKQKHPPRCNADPEILLPDKSEEVHSINVEILDAKSYIKITLKTRGGAGPLGLDAEV